MNISVSVLLASTVKKKTLFHSEWVEKHDEKLVKFYLKSLVQLPFLSKFEKEQRAGSK